MLRRSLVLLLVVFLAAMFIMGCEETDDEESKAIPGYAAGTTASDGSLILTTDFVKVTTAVKDGNGTPLEGASVSVFQGEEVVLIYAEKAGYYPWYSIQPFTESALLGFEDENAIRYDPELNVAALTVNLVLPTAGSYVYNYSSDMVYIQQFYEDEGFQKVCADGNLEAIFTKISDNSDIGSAMRVYGSAASISGASSINLSLISSGINQVIFDQMMFSFTSLYDDDVLGYCFYTVKMNGSTYAMPIIHIGELVSEGSASDFKIVLEWGENPRDLDLHVWTPPINDVVHEIYYGNRGDADNFPYIWLDTDDVSSYGPEVVTIVQAYDGNYTIAIRDYPGGTGTLATSGAKIKIFQNRQLLHAINVPTTQYAEDGWWWYVGKIDPTNTEAPFYLVNQIQEYSPDEVPPSIMLDKNELYGEDYDNQ